MPQVQTDYLKQCDPFAEYTTTTSTTTAAPTLEYYSLPVSGIAYPDFVGCGSLLIPSGAYLTVGESTTQYRLVHPADTLVDKGQQMIVTTIKMEPSSPPANYLTIHLGADVTLIHAIKVVAKIRETKKVLGQANIGAILASSTINNIRIPMLDTFNLYNFTIQLEITSVCHSVRNECCDVLPDVELLPPTGVLECTSTTTTTTEPPVQPFCAGFLLPDSFNVTVNGYGFLAGQTHSGLVTRYGNTWSVSGTFPCGAGYSLSMTCDQNTESFIYDGTIDCCEESTRSVIPPTSTPYLYPGAILPEIVSYTDCHCSPSCNTTTTTTDGPRTTQPPPPPLPCTENDEGYVDGPVTIRGYAMYYDDPTFVLFDGIGELSSKCNGGHWCNRTDFQPVIIIGDDRYVGNAISLNNGGDGGDRLATFSIVVDSMHKLAESAQIVLECLSPGGCHNGVTWVVLIVDSGLGPHLLFDGCVVPGGLEPLSAKCKDCCTWDGIGTLTLDANCGNFSGNIQFLQIAENLWEFDIILPCGDRFNMIVQCDPNIIFDEDSPDLDALCKAKWQMIHAAMPCATNFRLTGNLLALCACNTPPVWEFTADDYGDCECCSPISGIVWDFIHNGQISGNPWTLNPNLSSIRIDVEDSAICGGPNGNVQTGTATALIQTSTIPVTLSMTINGAGELQAQGFENMVVRLNGDIIGNATSQGGGLACAPAGPINVANPPAPQILAPNTLHTLTFEFTTGDALFHVGAFYEVDLLFNGQPFQ